MERKYNSEVDEISPEDLEASAEYFDKLAEENRKLDWDTTVTVQNVAPVWNGCTGKVMRWMHDDWYEVRVTNRFGIMKDLVLDSSRGEMIIVREEVTDDKA